MQTVTYLPAGGSGVNEDDPRYKCCCGVVHVHKGATVIAIVEIVLSILVALGGVSGVSSGKYKSSGEGGSYFNCLVTIIVCSLMIFGLWKTRRYFLVPHLVFQVLFIVICVLFAILFVILTIGFYAVTSNQEEYKEHRGQGVVLLITFAIVFAIVAAFQIWFFTVVLAAFRYLRDKEMIGFQSNPIFQYSGGRNV